MQIFSKEKFLEDFEYQAFYFEFILSQFGENNWVNLLNGKNKEEIEALGYNVIEEAMIEI